PRAFSRFRTRRLRLQRAEVASSPGDGNGATGVAKNGRAILAPVRPCDEYGPLRVRLRGGSRRQRALQCLAAPDARRPRLEPRPFRQTTAHAGEECAAMR